MAGRRLVLLVTEDQTTSSAVSAALESDSPVGRDEVLSDLPALAQRLESQSAAAVLVDIDPRPGQMLATLDPLVRRFPDTRFVVLSRSVASDLMLEAMQI